MGRLFFIIIWALNVIINVLLGREQRRCDRTEEAGDVLLEQEVGAMQGRKGPGAMASRQPPEATKGKGADSPLEPPEGTSPANNLT